MVVREPKNMCKPFIDDNLYNRFHNLIQNVYLNMYIRNKGLILGHYCMAI